MNFFKSELKVIYQYAAPTKERTLDGMKEAQSVLMGHDLMGAERFMPETRHMITLDVLNNDSPVGYKGERYRFFLSDEGYQNARRSEQRGEIAIQSHAAVSGGKLYPDRKLTSREREL